MRSANVTWLRSSPRSNRAVYQATDQVELGLPLKPGIATAVPMQNHSNARLAACDADKISRPIITPADLRSATDLLLGRHIDARH
jgi:hypothetical protein